MLLTVVQASGMQAARQSVSVAAASGEVEAELRAAVNEYFEAIRNKDWQRLDAIEVQRHSEMTLSGSDSHGPMLKFNLSLELTKRLLVPYEIGTLNFTINKIEVKGRQATVRATVNMIAYEVGTGTAAIDLRGLEMALHLDNYQSTWKVNFDQESDGLLAEQIKKVGTPTGRRFLFCQENLWGLSSAEARLKSEGIRLLEQKNLKQSFAVFELAQEIELHRRERAAVSAEMRAKRREADAEKSRDSGQQKDLALNHLWAGQDYAELKDFVRAEERLGESIKLLEALGDQSELAKAYREAAAVELEQGKYTRAINSYQNSIDKYMSVAAGDKGEREYAVSKIDDVMIKAAYLYSAQGKYDQAEEFVLRNSKRLEDLGATEDALLMMYVLSMLEMVRGDGRRAAENMEKVLLRLAQAGPEFEDRDKVAAGIRLMLVILYAQQSNFITAARHLERMRATEFKGEDYEEAAGWNHVLQLMDALLYGAQGNEDLIRSQMQRTLPGVVSSGSEELDIPDTLQAWSMGQMSKSLFSQGTSEVELSQDEFSLILQCLTFSESLALKAGDAVHAARAHQVIAALYVNKRRPAEAVEHYLKGLSLLEGATLPFKERDSAQMLRDNLLMNLSGAYRSLGDYDKAITTLSKMFKPDSLRLFRFYDQKAYLDVAKAYYALKDFGDAIKYAEEAARAAERYNDPDTLEDAYLLAGHAHRALDQPEAARRSYQSAIEQVELVGSQISGSEPSAAQFFEDQLKPYQAMTVLLLSRRDVDGALSYADRAKSKVLLNVLRNGRRSASQLMTARELEQDDGLRRNLMLLNRQVIRAQAGRAGEAEVRRLRNQRVEARLDYELFRARLYINHPELAGRRPDETDGFESEDGDRLSLLPDEAALEFMVTDEKTYLFVLTKKGGADGSRVAQTAAPDFEHKVYQIDIGANELKTLINNFRVRISHPEGVVGRRPRELYELLLGRAREQLAGKKSLIVIPDGVLWNLPFQALMTAEGRYLLEDFAISYAPSLTALKEMRRVREESVLRTSRAPARRRTHPTPSSLRAPSLLAVGDPGGCERGAGCGEVPLEMGTFEPLLGAGRLAKQLRDLYGARNSVSRSGRAADEATIKREAPQHQVIHIGTHGVLDDDNPMYSFLLLSSAAKKGKGLKAGGEPDGNEDGFLEAWELMELQLKTELIVLSACDTARGRVRNGEGVVGFSWAALIAGCPTVVVGHWKVDESGTGVMMYDFHKRWLADRKTNGVHVNVAAALQQSALTLLRSKKYSHPYYWAGFSVVGVGH